ncbi:MAG: hypothetical protein HY827_05950 [Actinobacteria bacterium]|nr:hypothetical protein [Actinomycetota bacterium]
MTAAIATLAALPIAADTGGGYVAAAYAVFVALLLVYIGIMAAKLVRLQRGLGDLQERTRKPGDDA